MKDHLERGTLDLSQLRFRVLDECDEMLNMGFVEDVEKILNAGIKVGGAGGGERGNCGGVRGASGTRAGACRSGWRECGGGGRGKAGGRGQGGSMAMGI